MTLPVYSRMPSERFFNFIFARQPKSTYIEMRAINPPDIRTGFFRTTNELMHNGLYAPEWPQRNLYFGVLPRTSTNGKRSNVAPTADILWADLDSKDGAEFATLITGLLPTPCVVVFSGNGWHAYWRLLEPQPIGIIELLNKNIAAIVGGDHVYDAARIMRVPYSLNVKENLEPRSATILKLDVECPGHHYGSFSFAPTKQSVKRAQKIVKANNMGRSRSEELFGVTVNYVLRGGNDYTELEALLLAHPAGTKLEEMSPTRRREWIRLTYANAKKNILRQPEI